MTDNESGEILVYIASGGEESTGVCLYAMDVSSGVLELLSRNLDGGPPGFMLFNSDQNRLYACTSIPGDEDQPNGRVSAFVIDPGTGELTFLNQECAQGDTPCYLSIDRTGRHLLVGTYSSGTVAVLPVAADGQLGPATDVVQHEGTSHVHSVVLDPDSRFVFVGDLGLDKIMSYRLDAERGRLTPNDPPWTETPAGAGPRHFAFHPNGFWAYVINQINNTFIAYSYDEEGGTLTPIQTIGSLPEGFSGTSWSGNILIHPSGQFLYGTNRGHNSIAIMEIDPDTGELTVRGHEPTRGDYPWHVEIDPTQSFLMAANSQGNNVVVFRIDAENGALTPTGREVEVPSPTCIRMIRR